MHQTLGPLQGLHYWLSAFLIAESVVLFAVMLWSGTYRRPFGPLFLASVLLMACSLEFQVTGNVLPMDRHGVETVVVETGISGRVPVVGSLADRAILGGSSFGPQTLTIWYGLHWAIALGVLCAAFALIRGRRHIDLRSIPRAALVIGVLLPVALTLCVPSPLGSAAAAGDFGAFGARVSWYMWPLHGALEMLDGWHPGWGWIGAVLVPLLIFLFLLFLPVFGDRIPVYVARIASTLVACFYLCAGVFYGGNWEPLVGTRDPAPLATSAVAVGPPIDGRLRSLGAQVFATQGCVSCHGPNGDAGGAGPPLKLIGRSHPTSDFFMRYVHQPTSIDPQSTMPAFPNLNQDQLSELAEFLRSKR